MVINVPEFNKTVPALVKFGARHKFKFLAMDQGALARPCPLALLKSVGIPPA